MTARITRMVQLMVSAMLLAWSTSVATAQDDDSTTIAEALIDVADAADLNVLVAPGVSGDLQAAPPDDVTGVAAIRQIADTAGLALDEMARKDRPTVYIVRPKTQPAPAACPLHWPYAQNQESRLLLRTYPLTEVLLQIADQARVAVVMHRRVTGDITARFDGVKIGRALWLMVEVCGMRCSVARTTPGETLYVHPPDVALPSAAPPTPASALPAPAPDVPPNTYVDLPGGLPPGVNAGHISGLTDGALEFVPGNPGRLRWIRSNRHLQRRDLERLESLAPGNARWATALDALYRKPGLAAAATLGDGRNDKVQSLVLRDYPIGETLLAMAEHYRFDLVLDHRLDFNATTTLQLNNVRVLDALWLAVASVDGVVEAVGGSDTMPPIYYVRPAGTAPPAAVPDAVRDLTFTGAFVDLQLREFPLASTLMALANALEFNMVVDPVVASECSCHLKGSSRQLALWLLAAAGGATIDMVGPGRQPVVVVRANATAPLPVFDAGAWKGVDGEIESFKANAMTATDAFKALAEAAKLPLRVEGNVLGSLTARFRDTPTAVTLHLAAAITGNHCAVEAGADSKLTLVVRAE